MNWIAPITDRTKNDVDKIKSIRSNIVLHGIDNLSQIDKLFWLYGDVNVLNLVDSNQNILMTSDFSELSIVESTSSSPKGSLNANDLNRIEGNCKYIQTILSNNGYYIPVITKTNWIMSDLPYLDEHINRLRNNIIKLTTQYLITQVTPIITESDYLNYIEVNNWETSLLTLFNYINIMIESYYQCGTLVCGEV